MIKRQRCVNSLKKLPIQKLFRYPKCKSAHFAISSSEPAARDATTNQKTPYLSLFTLPGFHINKCFVTDTFWVFELVFSLLFRQNPEVISDVSQIRLRLVRHHLRWHYLYDTVAFFVLDFRYDNVRNFERKESGETPRRKLFESRSGQSFERKSRRFVLFGPLVPALPCFYADLEGKRIMSIYDGDSGCS